MRILLATDGSTNADAALNVVLYRPWPAGTVVRVITVIEPLHDRINKVVGLFGLAQSAAEAQKRLQENCRSLVLRYTQALSAKFGAENVTADVIEGRDREKIPAEARSWKADVIIMGAHGQAASEEFLHGNVAGYVVGHAPCSVELIRFVSPSTAITEIAREQPVEEDKYLIAVDDSEHSTETLNMVLSRKYPPKSFFKVISVAEPLPYQAYSGLGPWGGAGSEEFSELVDKTIEAEKSVAEKVVASACEKLKAAFPDATVDGEVLEGYARDRILSAARDWPADLLIVGSHGRRGITEFVLGSVSKAVAAHSPCSVLVIRKNAK
jgi:nucleotide-binding universal stress UspA family protein